MLGFTGDDRDDDTSWTPAWNGLVRRITARYATDITSDDGTVQPSGTHSRRRSTTIIGQMLHASIWPPYARRWYELNNGQELPVSTQPPCARPHSQATMVPLDLRNNYCRMGAASIIGAGVETWIAKVDVIFYKSIKNYRRNGYRIVSQWDPFLKVVGKFERDRKLKTFVCKFPSQWLFRPPDYLRVF